MIDCYYCWPKGAGGGGVRTETQRSEWPDALQTVLGEISIWNLRHRERNRKKERRRKMLKRGGVGRVGVVEGDVGGESVYYK